MSTAPPGFAETLRAAIERRGLGLDRIREHLGARGVSLSAATLSYWQSGRSQPERRSSLAALPHLEAVLQMEPGGLRVVLPGPRDRARRCAVEDLEAVWPDLPHLRVLHRLDTTWDTELDRVSLHDVLVVGADRRQRRLTVRQLLRARTDGPDRRVVLHAHEDPTAGLPEIRPVQGCTLGRVVRDPAGVVGAELLFHAPLARGQTVLMEYELVSDPPGPLESDYHRRLRLPVRQYLLEVVFDAAALPAGCEAGRDGATHRVHLDAEHRVHLVDTGGEAGRRGLRWWWPEDRSGGSGPSQRQGRVNC